MALAILVTHHLLDLPGEIRGRFFRIKTDDDRIRDRLQQIHITRIGVFGSRRIDEVTESIVSHRLCDVFQISIRKTFRDFLGDIGKPDHFLLDRRRHIILLIGWHDLIDNGRDTQQMASQPLVVDLVHRAGDHFLPQFT